MKYNPNINYRCSKRLKDYDYSASGKYFVTICTQDRALLFGEVTVGAGLVSALMIMNDAGEMIERIYVETINSFENVAIDKYIVMPNHFHGTIMIKDDQRADTKPDPTIGDILSAFKSKTTSEYIKGVKTGLYPQFNKRIWQRNYYEHVIRNDADYQARWQYIDENPARWTEDEYNML